MPDMKQVKSSVCNHIRHCSLLSYLPSAGNPSTQPQIRRLALPLIRSIIQPNAHASLYRPTSQSPSFHRPRHTIQTHSSPPPTARISSTLRTATARRRAMVQARMPAPATIASIIISLVIVFTCIRSFRSDCHHVTDRNKGDLTKCGWCVSLHFSSRKFIS